jgi:hypothetical protein
MHELHADRETAERDVHAQPARQDSYWFGRQLGDEWQEEEPGIYRFVGTGRAPQPAAPTEESGDSLPRPPRQQADSNGAGHAGTREEKRRWRRRRRG